MRRRAPRPLAPAVQSLAAALAPATALAAVQGVWDEVVGPMVAAEASPVAEREGVLRVSCSSAVWAQELDLMGPDLVARLNAALGRETLVSLRCQATPPKRSG